MVQHTFPTDAAYMWFFLWKDSTATNVLLETTSLDKDGFTKFIQQNPGRGFSEEKTWHAHGWFHRVAAGAVSWWPSGVSVVPSLFNASTYKLCKLRNLDFWWESWKVPSWPWKHPSVNVCPYHLSCLSMNNQKLLQSYSTYQLHSTQISSDMYSKGKQLKE